MIDQIKSLMQKHDWYFEYSNDQKEWRKGSAEKQEILALMRKIPMNQIPELLKLVPEPIQKKWYIEFQLYTTPAEVADAVLDHNSIQPLDEDES
jgi:2-methylcitrate dehydratase PrpD